MKRFNLLLFFSALISFAYSQINMQGTIKRGSGMNTIDIYARPSASFSQKDDGITFSLAIPAVYQPAPVVVTPGKTPNGTGPVTGISGIRPNFLVNNIGTLEREVVVSTETINGVSHYVYVFLFSGTAATEHNWVAGAEQLLASISWGGCTSPNCLSSIKLVSLPDGGQNSHLAFWYYQVSPQGDITNYANAFYANADAMPPVNGGDPSALSVIELSTNILLPVKLLSFKGESANCNATLSWQATEEAGFAYYSVERSEEAMPFHEVARVDASINSTTVRSYGIVDDSSPSGRISYRLRLVDKDGNYAYSMVTQVNSDCYSKNSVIVYPTLSRGVVNVRMPAGFERADIRIFNANGQKVESDESIGLHRVMSLKGFSNGIYIIQVINNGMMTDNIKIVLRQ